MKRMNIKISKINSRFAWGFFLALAGIQIIPAQATQKVYSPIVEKGEAEVEFRGHVDLDKDEDKDEKQKYKVDLGYGFTDFWFSELIAEYENSPDDGDGIEYEATEWENIFQLFPQGKYAVDLGIFFEYSLADNNSDPDKIEIGPMLQKDIGNGVANFNLLFEREVESNANHDTAMSYAWRYKWLLNPYFSPAIEGFGELDRVTHAKSYAEQEHQVGPALYGKWKLQNGTAIKYELGLLFAVSAATADESLRWTVEYEF